MSKCMMTSSIVATLEYRITETPGHIVRGSPCRGVVCILLEHCIDGTSVYRKRSYITVRQPPLQAEHVQDLNTADRHK